MNSLLRFRAMDPKSWKPGRWAFVTVALYAATLCAVTWPLLALAFWKDMSTEPDTQLVQLFQHPAYLGILGGLSLLEGLALFFPVGIARQRPVPKRSWVLLAVVTGLMFALLIAGVGLSLGELLRIKDFTSDSELIPALFLSGGASLLGWLLWGVFFWLSARKRDERSWLRRIRNALLTGSILELLVAVPCHIVVRQRNDCCAGFGTFIGIATGVAVMLFAFGPGVFFLFAERAAALKPAAESEARQAPVRLIDARGRDAATWATLAAVFLFMPGIVQLVSPAGTTWQLVYISRISFMVLSAAACTSAARAWLFNERLWGVSVVCGVYLLEIAALIAIGWARGG